MSDSKRLMRTHSLVRTSPKGEPFIGRCTLCGRSNLRIDQSREHCENIRGLSNEEAIVEAIDHE